MQNGLGPYWGTLRAVAVGLAVMAFVMVAAEWPNVDWAGMGRTAIIVVTGVLAADLVNRPLKARLSPTMHGLAQAAFGALAGAVGWWLMK